MKKVFIDLITKNPIKDRYCSFCGKKLEVEKVGAEKAIGYEYSQLYNEYDSYTGKRQYVLRFKCPDAKWFLSRHSDYIDDDLVEEKRQEYEPNFEKTVIFRNVVINGKKYKVNKKGVEIQIPPIKNGKMKGKIKVK